ncbi:hypothetical protein [Aeromicrobium sp. UC242_57]|uniref:hypothetical protein n=1 Tax=Aeromicrobium sp. UC242_57 TaxID=3374624 RepID=UPI0037998DC3
MGKGGRLRRKREEKYRQRGEPASMAAYCATCNLISSAPWTAAVLQLEYADIETGEKSKVAVPVQEAALECAGCGVIVPVINAFDVPNAVGAVTVFGISPYEREAAIELANEIAASSGMTASEVADEIERRAPWLSRLARQIRDDPSAGMATGISVAGLAATVIFGIITTIDPGSGITPEQLDEILERHTPADPTGLPKPARVTDPGDSVSPPR